jgi:hypothetical protein
MTKCVLWLSSPKNAHIRDWWLLYKVVSVKFYRNQCQSLPLFYIAAMEPNLMHMLVFVFPEDTQISE